MAGLFGLALLTVLALWLMNGCRPDRITTTDSNGDPQPAPTVTVTMTESPTDPGTSTGEGSSAPSSVQSGSAWHAAYRDEELEVPELCNYGGATYSVFLAEGTIAEGTSSAYRLYCAGESGKPEFRVESGTLSMGQPNLSPEQCLEAAQRRPLPEHVPLLPSPRTLCLVTKNGGVALIKTAVGRAPYPVTLKISFWPSTT